MYLVLQVLRQWFADVQCMEEHFLQTLATLSLHTEVTEDTAAVTQNLAEDWLRDLNSFKQRKTFWNDGERRCHGKVDRIWPKRTTNTN